jgi:hypothetical protein
MRTGVLFATAALTVTAGVAACGGAAGEPQALPSLSPAASASPSPSPVPSGIQAPTAQGAADFVRFFYGQIERGFATKNPQLVAEHSEPGCSSCANYVRSMTKLRDNNERVAGFKIIINNAVAPGDTGNDARVDISWNTPATTRYDAAGNVIRREPAASGIEEQVNLVRSAGEWRVKEIQRIRVRGWSR